MDKLVITRLQGKICTASVSDRKVTGIILEEHRNGITTGRKIIAEIAYVWEDAGGLDDNYCIIGLANYEN